jgi:hypothetical protein
LIAKGFVMTAVVSQSQAPRKSRNKIRLNPKLDNRLIAYMTAATAAGVAMLGATPASAEIVFTPANVNIGAGGSYALDLNGDGIPDFTLHRCRCLGDGHTSFLFAENDVQGNGVRDTPRADAAAMPIGAFIGDPKAFTTTNSSYGFGQIMARAFYYTQSIFSGPWANATNKYLGLRFVIAGQIHYGWARLTVTNFNQHGTAVLTGYAYETEPELPIRAGEKSDGSAVVFPPFREDGSRSLGELARGADAVYAWRRDEMSSASQPV